MLSEVPFSSYLVYSPRGTSALAIESRRVRDAIKYWHALPVRNVLVRMARELGPPLDEFLNNRVTLVPAPRSAPLLRGALNPPRLIADELRKLGLGREVASLLIRMKAVRKAAFAGWGERPSIREHLETMTVKRTLVSGDSITVVDDFVTKGSSLFAAITLVAEAYPRVPVRGFALVRTMGLVADIERIIDPVAGIIRNIGGEGDRQP